MLLRVVRTVATDEVVSRSTTGPAITPTAAVKRTEAIAKKRIVVKLRRKEGVVRTRGVECLRTFKIS